MSWEAVSAIASIASAFVVLIAAIAAVRQLRHMRLANQLSSFFQVMAWVQSAEGIEARRFLASLDLKRSRATLLAVTTPKVDHRLTRNRRSLPERCSAAQSRSPRRFVIRGVLRHGAARLERIATDSGVAARANRGSDLDRFRILGIS